MHLSALYNNACVVAVEQAGSLVYQQLQKRNQSNSWKMFSTNSDQSEKHKMFSTNSDQSKKYDRLAILECALSFQLSCGTWLKKKRRTVVARKWNLCQEFEICFQVSQIYDCKYILCKVTVLDCTYVKNPLKTL